MKGTQGFTLVELAVVIAIIIVLAAIAIPSLLQSRIAANEAEAIGDVRVMTTAQLGFVVSKQATLPDGRARYAENLAELLTPPNGPPFLDEILASGQRRGYNYACAGAPAAQQFTASARPRVYGFTGVRSFFADETGVIRFTTQNAPADAGSAPLG